MTWTTFVNGTLANATEVNENFNMSRNFTPTIYTSGHNFQAIIGHSATIYSKINTTGSIYLSSDSGVTWTLKNGDLDTYSFLRKCKVNSAYAVAIEQTANGEVAYTSDSGTTWTTKTSCGLATDVHDISFPTTTLIVIAGQDGVKGIQFSTDGGTTWTDATTCPTNVIALDMFDGTTGFCIDTSGNIWKTVNAAVDWTDTTHNASVPVSALARGYPMYSISATSFVSVLCGEDSGTIQLYDGTGNATNKFSGIFRNYNGAVTITTTSIGIIKLTNNKLIAGISLLNVDEFDVPYVLLISDDNGVTWTYGTLGINEKGTDNVWSVKCCIDEYTTNKLFITAYNSNYVFKLNLGTS